MVTESQAFANRCGNRFFCKIFAVGLLRTYIDDSADQTQDKVMLAGAFIGWNKQWIYLRDRWKKCLKRHRLTFFHATECRSLQGEFSRFRDSIKYPKPKGREVADHIRGELEAIIHKSQIMGVAACVPMKDYKEIRAKEPNAAEIFPQDGYEMALQAMFQLCAETVLHAMDHVGGQPHRVAFICDHSTSALRMEKMFVEFRNKNPEYCDVLEGLVHQDDKKQPHLKAADLMAHVAKDRLMEWLDDPKIFTDNAEVKKRLDYLSVYTIAVCHRGWLLSLLDMERKKRGLI